MSERVRLDKYFDIELPEEKLLFHVSMVLSICACFIMMLLTLLIRMDFYVPGILLAAVLWTAAAMYMESKTDRIHLISAVYLFIMYFVLLPMMSLHVPYAIYDLPVYFLTGIIYIAFLFKKKWALPFVAADSVISLLCIYNMLRKNSELSATQSISTQYSVLLFFRIIVALFIMGTICGVLTSYRSKILRRKIKEGMVLEKQAEQVSYAKDMFLVNVSHEIRTPLNAILGIADLLMEQDVDDNIKESAFHLSNSSRALLSITNELMDFSKLEDIDPVITDKPYYIEDIFNELINVFSVRFADYKTELFVDIAPDIPKQLSGDVTMVRQVLLNVMSGVVKSLVSGEVYLQVCKGDSTDDCVRLMVEVRAEGMFRYSYEKALLLETDEDIANMSSDETMTPLPFRLINLMGGEIHMEENGDKRAYNFDILQGRVESRELVERPSAALESSQVLFYENTAIQRSMLAKTLGDLGVDFYEAANGETFLKECVDSGYTHLLIASEKYESIKNKLEELLSPQSIILIGSEMMIYDDMLVKTTFARPVNCLNLDALLCGRQNNMIRNIGYKGGFICPDVHVMVVDDNIVNLEVAVSFLNRYRTKVTVVSGGKECLKRLQKESVDIILLDYMMPEMDGIDTLKNIRALNNPELKEVPIIALTANAVSGAREMFLDAGFNEYISKPIERDKFEKILLTYLPKEKIIYTTDKEESAEQTA